MDKFTCYKCQGTGKIVVIDIFTRFSEVYECSDCSGFGLNSKYLEQSTYKIIEEKIQQNRKYR